MKNVDTLKMQLDQSFDQFQVPESLYRLADEIPESYAKGEFRNIAEVVPMLHRRKRSMSKMLKTGVAAAAVVLTLSVGVTISPAFASLVKDVPGFAIAVDWLSQVREQDGVQKAINHGYTPIESITKQIGGTTITISDIYITDEELLFKTFIRTDEFDVTDGRRAEHFFVSPNNLKGGGSTTASRIVKPTDGSNQPILQESYKYQLQEGAVKEFFDQGSDLQFELRKTTFNNELKTADSKDLTTISVPVDQTKLLHNKIIQPNQSLAIGDPDLKELVLEKLTIQPTTMNLMMKGNQGWDLYYPREEGKAPYLQDDKGNKYFYDPSGPGLHGLEQGTQQLPFSSSVFFDPDVKSMSLHIGELNVTERTPSGSLDLSLNDTFPKTVRFKNRDIMIEGVEYHALGYLELKIRKEQSEQKWLEGVYFDIGEANRSNDEIDKYNKKYEEITKSVSIVGFGTADSYKDQKYHSLYLIAPKQDSYKINIRRGLDHIVVNKDYLIQLK
jgi:hypothetical protein